MDTPHAQPGCNDRYATWDAAYLLGTLERSERLAYEQHLTSCPSCLQAITDMAVLPGLLARVDPDVALALIDPQPTLPEDFPQPAPETPHTDLAPVATLTRPRLRLRPRVRGHHRTVALASALVSAVASAVIAVPITAIATHHARPTTETHLVAERQLQPLVPTPVSASVKVLDMQGRATIEMSCSYATGTSPYRAAFELWLTSRDGVMSRLLGWWAGPGDMVTLSSSTSLTPDQVRGFEIRSSNSGQTLLVGQL